MLMIILMSFKRTAFAELYIVSHISHIQSGNYRDIKLDSLDIASTYSQQRF
jgi:hypothetical protein